MNTASEITPSEIVDIPEGKTVEKPPSKQIRNDIQILRAISIILVLLYHLEVPRVKGGFIGVDIFFVISGYLVTGSFISMLLKKSNEQKPNEQESAFSIYITFLIRRIKRLILPSAICLICVLIGVYVSPLELPNGRENVRYAALNYINFYLWQISSTYGGDETRMNVVLHYWSLAVEWQFYFISPIILMSVWKCCEWFEIDNAVTKHCFRVSLIAFSALTFGLCFAGTTQARFYLLHTRTWEFLVGAMVNMDENLFLEYVLQPIEDYLIKHLLLSKHHVDLFYKFVVCSLFVALSIGGYFIELKSWPGWMTLYPVGLTAACILFQRNFGNGFVITKALILIGNWSYSAYLWHWPIIIFSKVYILQTESVSAPFFWGCCLFLTFCTTLVSYYVIEKIPLQTQIKKLHDYWWIVVFVLLTVLIVGLTFMPLQRKIPIIPPEDTNWTLQPNITSQQRKDLLQNTWNMLDGPNAWLTEEYAKTSEADFRRKPWLFAQRDKTRCMVLIGDSHAIQFHHAWQYVGKQYNISLYHLVRRCSQGQEACYLDVFLSPFPFSDVFSECKHFLAFIGTWHYNMQNLTDWEESIKRVIIEYTKHGQVFLFKDLEWGVNPRPWSCIYENAVEGKDIKVCKKTVSELTTITPKYQAVVDAIQNNTNFGVIDLIPSITNRSIGYAYNYDYPIFMDEHHLAPDFMYRFGYEFLKNLKKDLVFQKFVGGM